MRIAKLVNNETDLKMEQGADSAAVPVDMSPSFKRLKEGGLDLIFCILKKHYFHDINLKRVTTASSQGCLSLRWSTICLCFHATQKPGPVTSVAAQLRSPWQRAESRGALGELLRNPAPRAPCCPGRGTSAAFLGRISKSSPPQSHSPGMTSALVKTNFLQHFF